jgi:hypothetical protein
MDRDAFLAAMLDTPESGCEQLRAPSLILPGEETKQ